MGFADVHSPDGRRIGRSHRRHLPWIVSTFGIFVLLTVPASAASDSEAMKIYQSEFQKADIDLSARRFDEAYDHNMRAGDAIAASNPKFAAFGHLMAMDVLRAELAENWYDEARLKTAVAYIDRSILPTISAATVPDLWSRAKFYRGVFRQMMAIHAQAKHPATDMAAYAGELKSVLADYDEALEYCDKDVHKYIWWRIAFQAVGVEDVLGRLTHDKQMLIHARSLAQATVDALDGPHRAQFVPMLNAKMKDLDAAITHEKS